MLTEDQIYALIPESIRMEYKDKKLCVKDFIKAHPLLDRNKTAEDRNETIPTATESMGLPSPT